MRSLKAIIAASVLLAAFAIQVQAGDQAADKAADTPKELKNQTHCPVMGGKIDSTAFTDIQGQRVYHCCPICTEKLTANPDKYFKEAAAQGIVFENIQTTCPICDMKLANKDTHIDYEGRRVAFCSDGCRTAFSKNPDKFLSKLDEQGEHKSSHENHEGHDHQDHGSH